MTPTDGASGSGEASLIRRAFPELDADQARARFFTEIWSRRPLFMPGAASDLIPELDADELAGLACEDGVESRLVTRDAAGFRTEHGPLAEARFESLGDRDWTLLVNAVDHHLPEVGALQRLLPELPNWRQDDVMVSFAATGGSVGPHLDRYDVFLIQARGHRRWELGAAPAGDDVALRAEGGLELVHGFSPDHVVETGPGDVLYVPPGVIHHGIALDPCITISLGLRAPDRVMLVDDWLQEVLAQLEPVPAELDPPLPVADAGHLDDATLAAAAALVEAALSAARPTPDRLAPWLGRALSLAPRAEPPLPPERPLQPEALRGRMEAGAALAPMPGLRLLWRREDEGVVVYAAGERYPSTAAADWVARLCGGAPLDLPPPHDGLPLLAALYNAGVLEFEAEDRS